MNINRAIATVCAAILIWVAFGLPLLRAQTHPCDQTPTTSLTLRVTDTPHLWFCEPVGIAGGFAYVTPASGGTTTKQTLANFAQTTPTPNAAGLVQYMGTFASLAKGNWTVKGSAYVLDAFDGSIVEGGQSSPFALSIVDATAPPPIPTVVYVTKS